MAWKVRYVQYDITASKSGERFWKRLYNAIPEPEFIMELREECDCEWPQHSDGGHYHRIWKIYRLDEENFLIVEDSTREAFTPWEQGFVYVRNGGLEYCVWSETIGEVSAKICKKQEVREMVQNLLESGNVYIEEGELVFE